MKIGILTQPLRGNYGGNIQNWALQQTLRRLGHRPITVNLIRGSKPTLLDRLRYIKNFTTTCYARYVRHDWSRYINNPFRNKYCSHEPSRLDGYFRRNIAKTNELPVGDPNWKKKAEIDTVEAFIVGSDQVWRESFSPDITTYFLDFIPKNDQRPRIAYAASFGCDRPVSDDKIDRCSELLSGFNHVSVRERSGLSVLSDTFDYKSGTLVLDPTLLLTADDYESLIRLSDRRGACVGLYILDPTDDKFKIAKYEILRTGVPSRYIKLRYEGFHHPTMSEWLAMFADAEYVVTDSFHGCVFSIIFRKPFVAIANRERGLDRFTSLLDMLNLSDRLVYDYDDFRSRLTQLHTPIDWIDVYNRLNTERIKSIKFLKDALS